MGKEEIAWKLTTHTPPAMETDASLTNPKLLLPSVDTKKFLEISMLIPSTKMDLTPSICMLTPTSNITAVESLTLHLGENKDISESSLDLTSVIVRNMLGTQKFNFC